MLYVSNFNPDYVRQCRHFQRKRPSQTNPHATNRAWYFEFETTLLRNAKRSLFPNLHLFNHKKKKEVENKTVTIKTKNKEVR